MPENKPARNVGQDVEIPSRKLAMVQRAQREVDASKKRGKP